MGYVSRHGVAVELEHAVKIAKTATLWIPYRKQISADTKFIVAYNKDPTSTLGLVIRFFFSELILNSLMKIKM